jgi:hypothetical protein
MRGSTGMCAATQVSPAVSGSSERQKGRAIPVPSAHAFIGWAVSQRGAPRWKPKGVSSQTLDVATVGFSPVLSGAAVESVTVSSAPSSSRWCTCECHASITTGRTHQFTQAQPAPRHFRPLGIRARVALTAASTASGRGGSIARPRKDWGCCRASSSCSTRSSSGTRLPGRFRPQ